MKLLTVILPFAAFAGACAAQGCYQFSGSNITLQVNITAIDTTSGPDGGTTLYVFNSDNALTLNGTTQMSGESESGTATITYLPGLGTTFGMGVPTSTTGFWNVTLGSLGDAIPSLLLPSPADFPPISAWNEGGNSNFITAGSEKNAPTYPVTSVGACTGTPPTGGGSPPPASSAPTITAVQDAGSYAANIAQGSIFVIKGTNLSASGLKEEAFPLPASDEGVSIDFTPSKGAAIQPYLVYLYNENGVNQLAAILPSNTPTGSYKVTVTNGTSTSANFPATVVAMKPGLITQDSSGSGLAVVQNYVSATELDVNRFTTGAITGGATISPAHPGQTEIAWLTGMGGVAGGDDVASPGYN